MKIAIFLPPGNPSTWTLNPNNPASDVVYIFIGNLIKFAVGLAGAVAVIYLIIGAINYFTAFGNEEKATKAKTTITWAIIGIVVIVLAEVIVTIVWQFITPEKLQLPT
jgi:hypothetical protein